MHSPAHSSIASAVHSRPNTSRSRPPVRLPSGSAHCSVWHFKQKGAGAPAEAGPELNIIFPTDEYATSLTIANVKHWVTTTATLTAFLQTVMSLREGHGPLWNPPLPPPLALSLFASSKSESQWVKGLMAVFSYTPTQLRVTSSALHSGESEKWLAMNGRLVALAVMHGIPE